MSLLGLLSILFNHLKTNFLKVLLGAMGIMVGVWAIILTITLSGGLQTQLQIAINSQPITKSIQVYQESGNINSILDIRPESKFSAIPYSKIESLAKENPNILDFAPSDLATLFVNTDPKNTNCVNQNIQSLLDTTDQNTPQKPPANCYQQSIINVPFQVFYQSQKNNWYGQTTKPEKNQIVSCFICNKDNPFHKLLDVTSPSQLIGKKISIEINSINSQPKAGDTVELAQLFPIQSQIPKTQILEYEIVSVIDDSVDISPLSSPFKNNFFASRDFYIDANNQKSNPIPIDQVGYTELNFFIQDIKKLQETIDYFKNQGFFVVSTGQILSNSLNTLFFGLTIILSIFAGISLFAAVFGIVSVMIFSTISRKKEIAILKSLGARGKDIFSIFLLESLYIGILGWLLGFIISSISIYGINKLFEVYLEKNPNFGTSLGVLDINNLSLDIQNNTLILTFALAVLTTSVSGIIPALLAARTDPAPVLKSE
jgi:ABC-type lipoprotein release transport system permease subunit